MCEVKKENSLNVQLSEKSYLVFGSFIKVPQSGKLPKEKIKRVKFIEKYILGNRLIMKRSHGFQLCTTAIGRALDVNPQTVTNWIKQLIRENVLVVKSGKWYAGIRSKTYLVNLDNAPLVDFLNSYTGYKVCKHKKKIAKKKYEIRSERWKKLDVLNYDFEDLLPIAQCYLGCEKKFLTDLKQNVPKEILRSPRETNIKQAKIMDFYQAFKMVTDNNNKGKNFTIYKRSHGLKRFLGKDVHAFKYLEFNYNIHDEKQIAYIDKQHKYSINLWNKKMEIAKAMKNFRIIRRLKELKQHLNLVRDYCEDEKKHGIVLREVKYETLTGASFDLKEYKAKNWWVNWKMLQARTN